MWSISMGTKKGNYSKFFYLNSKKLVNACYVKKKGHIIVIHSFHSDQVAFRISLHMLNSSVYLKKRRVWNTEKWKFMISFKLLWMVNDLSQSLGFQELGNLQSSKKLLISWLWENFSQVGWYSSICDESLPLSSLLRFSSAHFWNILKWRSKILFLQMKREIYVLTSSWTSS